LQRLYLGMLFLAVVSLWFLPFPVMVTLSVCLLLLFYARRIWNRRAELGGEPVQLVWDGEQRWWWTQGGVEREAELLGESYLASRLVVLNFRFAESRGRRALVLTPTAIGNMLFRQLLVRFRISPQLANGGRGSGS